MNTIFRNVTFYDGEGEPFETKDAYRLFFQAMRHVEEYAEESIMEWATRLQEKNFYPITDELTDGFVTGQIKYEYEEESIEKIGDIEELNEYLVDEEELEDSDEMDGYSNDEDIEYEEDEDYYDSGSYEGSYAGRSPNDQRSDVMNPNNEEYKTNNDNRSNQMNPNNPAYRSSRGRRC